MLRVVRSAAALAACTARLLLPLLAVRPRGPCPAPATRAQVGARFPVINGLLNVIRRKKSKDTLVLASAVAACVLLITIYLFAAK